MPIVAIRRDSALSVKVNFFQMTMAGMTAVELAVMVLAGLLVYTRWRYTLAEAITFAIVTVFMALSLALQGALLVGSAWLAYGLEALMVAAAVWGIMAGRHELGGIVKSVAGFIRRYGHVLLLAGPAWCYLGLQAFLLPPSTGQWGSLRHILALQSSGFSIALHDVTFHGLPGPLNATILTHLLLRYHTDLGCGMIGFMAYLAIGSATYALARRYSWPPTAFTVSVVVLSMPRLVYHAVSPGAEIVPTAAAIFCILAIFRILERPNIRDFFLLTVGIFFAVAGGRMCLVIPFILMTLSVVTLIRRHGAITWWALIKAHRMGMLLTVIPAVIFSQSWLFFLNVRRAGEWIGAPEWSGFAFNSEGLYGSAANLLRYLLESADFLDPLDRVVKWLLGFSPVGLLEGLARVIISPVFGERGAGAPFAIHWVAHDALAWFGPLAFLLVLPAVAFAMFRGPRRLKATAVALAGYFYLVTLIPVWLPGNAHYFTFFYACGGFCVAFLLPPWRFTRTREKGLQVLTVLILCYGLWGNTYRPLVIPTHSSELAPVRAVEVFPETLAPLRSTTWASTNWGLDRWAEARRLFGDDRVRVISGHLAAGARVGLVLPDPDWDYPFLLAKPDVKFIHLQEPVDPSASTLHALQLDYLLYFDTGSALWLPCVPGTRLWSADQKANIKGGLIKLE
jgi:hypothetical protein